MPQKPSMRTWGTRFDTLPTSPVSLPVDEAADASETAPLSTLDNSSDKFSQKKEDKMPHDASVFVGSLPSAIDQVELTRLLSEHLSEHAEVKNVKVVRDSKGGVCAFVQCEDAASAATLIHTLHSNPQKTFLGRTLRYEPARAFRTLLISYRTPVQYIPFNRDIRSTGNDLPNAGQTVKLDLPYAMRAWKPRNSKFISLLYNAEAVDAENHSRNIQGVASENPSLFLQPVAYDAETIRNLAMYFGRLECFDPYDLSDKGDDVSGDTEKWKAYPPPHNAPRSPDMDVGCWEIKWDHRDDCVSALMSLRRIPHLTVTWAHQPPPFGSEQRSPYHNHSPHMSVVSYPLHVQGRLQNPTDTFHTIESDESTRANAGTSTTDELSKGLAVASTKTDDGDDWIAESATVDSPPESTQAPEETASTETGEWSEMDFPPLSTTKGQTKAEYGVWSEKMLPKQTTPRSPLSTTSQLASPHEESSPLATLSGSLEVSFQFKKCEVQELEMPPTPSFGMSPLTPKTPGLLYPITPIDDTGFAASSYKDHDSGDSGYHRDSNRTARELDPYTLFVGGLETFGPGAWDEAKVERYFARFGGLESVKVVRPVNSHASFAFVKFNNIESPARAVYEEHNRIYEGRAMRVQLRECNPPRGQWRNSRGRGRHHLHLSSHRRFLDHPDDKPNKRSTSQEGYDHDTAAVIPGFGDNGLERTAHEGNNSPHPEQENDDNVQGHNRSTDSRLPTPEHSVPEEQSHSESYREWYEEPLSAPLTAPPSSFSSSTSATVPPPALSYPISSGYYPPPPWMHPYAQQAPYPVPYFPFPGYPVAGQPVPQIFPGLPGTDASGSGGAAQNPWSPTGMYGSYIPYPMHQSTQPASTANMESQHLNSRAPLAPTGFIQNEHGALIAVYQPEALDRYMAGTRVPSGATPHLGQTNWPSFPPSHSYAYPIPPPLSSRQIPSSTSMGWPANPGLIPPQAHQHTQHSNPQNPGATFRGGHNDIGGQASVPAYKRQLRRDQGHMYSHGRQGYQHRSFPGRHTRGNMINAGYGEAHPRTLLNSGDWSQWSAGR